ncbi:LysR family transcriptional regulator, partial [Sedimenticola sp.]|uniref:LysR family transcriptional regulator n=1 Tax=Sedimenticola sp. TaxID=1940285 RepID=UPI003D12D89B
MTMNWDDLRFFVALAECHTVTAAATRLGVNYVTVSRRIDRLEEALKQTLFDREKDGYHLTVEGLTLYRKMQPLQQNMDELVQGLDPAQRHKRCIKLSTVPSLAEHLVTPNLVRLQQQYPEIRLDVDASTHDVSVVRREADIALRLDLPESGECIARKLGELSYRLCGTPDWIERFHSGGEVATISYGGNLSNLPEARYIRQHFGSHSVRFQSNSVNVQKR